MKRILTVTLIAMIMAPFRKKKKKGMWLPMLVGKYNLEDMQSKGFKLTAEDIYSINQPSIKDAIVIFGGGCTGEVISPEGLLITNHHCGYGAIQRLSSVENDYLMHGFWAANRLEELPNPGLSVSFLVRMDDVTERILNAIPKGADEAARQEIVAKISKEIVEEATQGNHYSANVKPMFYGNQYFVFVYEIFTDVRLVGTPPSAIGKFGGDTDNWMWPRHTGDFALFRIYADKDNKPASYSPDNVPYTPKRFLPISTKGLQPNDFTMVYGYPGSTQQYITSQAVEHVVSELNPTNISLRDVRLDIMEKYMKQNDTIRIKYASKQAGVANAWKKWQGEKNGLIRLKAVEQKQDLETRFAQWTSETPQREQEYGHLLNRFAELYNQRNPLNMASSLSREAFYAVELLQMSRMVRNSIQEQESLSGNEELTTRLLRYARNFYKDYHKPVDVEVFEAMMSYLHEVLPSSLQPKTLNSMTESNSQTLENYYQQSIFSDSTLLIKLIQNGSKESVVTLQNDVMWQLGSEFDQLFNEHVFPQLKAINDELDLLYRTYVRGLMEMDTQGVFFPDANFTLRVTYGKAEGYFPADGMEYAHQTTLDGIMEKASTGNEDYEIPTRLRELYNQKDYGKWEVNGTIPVCFLASNHTSGGNSGSPLINGEGHLVGLNFDRVWEGTMSDIMFDPEMCRNISVDIRYALFIIDKYANAGHLLNEMQLID